MSEVRPTIAFLSRLYEDVRPRAGERAAGGAVKKRIFFWARGGGSLGQ
jgi:hypothetical protein